MNEIILNALNRAHNDFIFQMNKGNFKDNFDDCFYVIATFIHWILDSIEESEELRFKYPEIRFINNQIKHNCNLIAIDSMRIKGGLSFPQGGIPFGVINKDNSVTPLFSIPEYTLVWACIDSNLIDEKYRNQIFDQYKDNYVGKSVKTTLDKAYSEIINYYSTYETN